MANTTDDQSTSSWFCDAGAETEGHSRECLLNTCASFLHLGFTLAVCLVIIWSRWCSVIETAIYLRRWPGHMYRYLLIFTLSVLALASLGEGILRAMVRKEDMQPQFYLPSCFLLLATVTSMIYYQLAEKWKTPHLCFLLVLYWLGCIGVNVTRIIYLAQTADIDAVILWISIGMTVIYVVLMMMELQVIALQVWYHICHLSCCC